MNSRAMDKIEETRWVWAVVEDPGGSEHLLGQHEATKDIRFIPAFLDKEIALRAFSCLTLEPGKKYEVQAIIFEDLNRYALEQGWPVFFLGPDGKVLKKISP